MEITVQEEQEMAALQRKDYRVRVFHEGATPKRADLRKELAKQLKAKENLVVVRRIKPAFGSSSSTVEASVYHDGTALQRFEAGYIVKRHASTKEDASAEVPKEAPKEEPAEAPKEAEQ